MLFSEDNIIEMLNILMGFSLAGMTFGVYLILKGKWIMLAIIQKQEKIEAIRKHLDKAALYLSYADDAAQSDAAQSDGFKNNMKGYSDEMKKAARLCWPAFFPK